MVCLTSILVAVTLMGAPKNAVFEGSDPLQWSQEPHATRSDSATMVAESFGKARPVEYLFECTSAGDRSSGWQSQNRFVATGLKPNSSYTFVAQARDATTRLALRAPSRSVTVRTRKANRMDQAMDGIELIPIMVNGDKDNRINIVVVNRWRKGESAPYNKPEMRETFLKDVRHAVEGPFTLGHDLVEQPFASQRQFFNVYALWWPGVPPWDPETYDRNKSAANRQEDDLDEEAAHWSTYNEIRERLFLPWQIEGKGWVTHLAMPNSRGGGGGAGRLLDRRVGDAMIEGNDIPPFYHEFNHTAMGLGDKYIGWGMWGRADESANTTLVFQRDKVKWKAWIDPMTPVPTPYNKKYLHTVGLSEGAVHRPAYVFRTTPVCTMGVSQFAEHLCPVCIQSAAERTYLWVNPIEDPKPARSHLTLKTPGRAQFSISRVKPNPDTQKVEWRLNGKLIATGVDAVDVDLGAIASYELECSLVDRTQLIREDPPFAEYPKAKHLWRIANPRPTSKTGSLRLSAMPQNASCLGKDDGGVKLAVSGGKAPYSFKWSNGSTGNDLKNVGEGKYSVQVVDAEFRSATVASEVQRPTTVKIEPSSELANGRWNVSLLVTGDSADRLSCRWSTGAKGLRLKGVKDGTYGYRATHKSGAVFSGEVRLSKPAKPLVVSVAEVVPSTGENNGQIRLQIEGGRAPYTVRWADKPEDAGKERFFLRPGSYKVVVQDANSTTLSRTATIKDVAPFELDRPTFQRSPTGGVMVAKPIAGWRYLWFAEDYPSYILRAPRGVYEGTYTDKDGRVFQAEGAIIPNTNGKWVNPPESDPENNKTKNDYGSWVRLEAYVGGRKAMPTIVRIQTNDKGGPVAKLDIFGVQEAAAEPVERVAPGTWKGSAEVGRMTVRREGPKGGRFDLFYTARHERVSRPLYVGNDFHPAKPGNYYVAAQRLDTGAISSNRIGVSITMGATHALNQKELRPDSVKGSKVLLWLDADDWDGDAVPDAKQMERGSLLGWRGKPGAMSPGGFVICEPNLQNGKAVASWQYIWLEQLEKEIKGYQTIIMVYRDHELSKSGTGPWSGVPACMWDYKGMPAPADLKNAKAWLNGNQVDPTATPAPSEFCVATFEYPSKRDGLRSTTTEWEGAVAEFIAYDGVLTDEERKAVEEYLRRKWLSGVHLETAKTQ